MADATHLVKERRKRYHTKYMQTLRGKISHRLTLCRRDSKRRGYEPCTATLDEVFAAWTGKCEICGTQSGICIDHDHVTGQFRGFLCQDCNRALGMMGESTRILTKAIVYLEKHR